MKYSAVFLYFYDLFIITHPKTQKQCDFEINNLRQYFSPILFTIFTVSINITVKFMDIKLYATGALENYFENKGS